MRTRWHVHRQRWTGVHTAVCTEKQSNLYTASCVHGIGQYFILFTLLLYYTVDLWFFIYFCLFLVVFFGATTCWSSAAGRSSSSSSCNMMWLLYHRMTAMMVLMLAMVCAYLPSILHFYGFFLVFLKGYCVIGDVCFGCYRGEKQIWNVEKNKQLMISVFVIGVDDGDHNVMDVDDVMDEVYDTLHTCLLYTSPSPRD